MEATCRLRAVRPDQIRGSMQIMLALQNVPTSLLSMIGFPRTVTTRMLSHRKEHDLMLRLAEFDVALGLLPSSWYGIVHATSSVAKPHMGTPMMK